MSQVSKTLEKLEASPSKSEVFYRVFFSASSKFYTGKLDNLKSLVGSNDYHSMKLGPTITNKVRLFISNTGFDLSLVKSIMTLSHGDISILVDTKADAIQLSKLIDEALEKASEKWLKEYKAKKNSQVEFPVDKEGYATTPDPEYVR